MKKFLFFAYLLLILILSSCNTINQTAGYPNIYSVHHKKSGFFPSNRNQSGNAGSMIKDFVKADPFPIIISNTNRIPKDRTSAQSMENTATIDIQPIQGKPELQISENNQGAITASLTDEPFVSGFSFLPDTSIKTTIPDIDSSGKIGDTLPPGDKTNANDHLSKQEHPGSFAIISITAALLSIATLILALPGAFILLAIAAIVFGAIGLKSKRRKMALAGMIIGILDISFLILAILLYSL